MSTLFDVPVHWRVPRRRPAVLGFLVGLALGVATLGLLWTAHVGYVNCGHVSQLERVIQASERRSLKTLGKPGGNAYAYYHTHPDELRKARADLRQGIEDFAPHACQLLPF